MVGGEIAALARGREGRGAFAFGGAGCAARVAGYGGAGLEAGELGGVVHLGVLLGGVGGLRAVGLGHVAAGPARRVVLVEGEGVDGLAVGGGGLRAEVEDPDYLRGDAVSVTGRHWRVC